MKIKKILSLAMALGIVAGSLGTAAYADAVPTIKMTPYEYGTEEGTAYIEEKNGEAVKNWDEYEDGVYIPDGCTGYLVVASVENMPDMKKATKGAHNRFGGIEAYFDISNADNIHHIAGFTYGMIDTSATGGTTSAGEAFLKPSSSVSSSYPTDSAVVNKVDDVSALFIVLKDKNVPVTFKAIDASDVSGLFSGAYTVAYSGSTMGAATAMYTKDGAATFAAESFTLGQASVGYSFTEGEKYTVEADGINGVVWAGNEMKNVDAANNNYVATFTADGAEPKTRTLTNLPEATTFTFDAILRFKDNTVKSGLAFDVVEEAK